MRSLREIWQNYQDSTPGELKYLGNYLLTLMLLGSVTFGWLSWLREDNVVEISEDIMCSSDRTRWGGQVSEWGQVIEKGAHPEIDKLIEFADDFDRLEPGASVLARIPLSFDNRQFEVSVKLVKTFVRDESIFVSAVPLVGDPNDEEYSLGDSGVDLWINDEEKSKYTMQSFSFRTTIPNFDSNQLFELTFHGVKSRPKYVLLVAKSWHNENQVQYSIYLVPKNEENYQDAMNCLDFEVKPSEKAWVMRPDQLVTDLDQ